MLTSEDNEVQWLGQSWRNGVPQWVHLLAYDEGDKNAPVSVYFKPSIWMEKPSAKANRKKWSAAKGVENINAMFNEYNEKYKTYKKYLEENTEEIGFYNPGSSISHDVEENKVRFKKKRGLYELHKQKPLISQKKV